MNTRLQQFLAAENISQSNFADTIGVARASISHIISGRNKPGFDFMVSVARYYPALNIDWLITGRGKMYKNSQMDIPEDTDPGNLFSDTSQSEEQDELFEPDSSSEKTVSELPEVRKQTKTHSDTEKARITIEKDRNKGSNRIRKILVLFDDNTYQELT